MRATIINFHNRLILSVALFKQTGKHFLVLASKKIGISVFLLGDSSRHTKFWETGIFHFKEILWTTCINESNCWLQAYPEFLDKETDRERHDANINGEISGWWKFLLKPSGEWIPAGQPFSTLAPVRQSPPPPAALSFSISRLNPPSAYLSPTCSRLLSIYFSFPPLSCPLLSLFPLLHSLRPSCPSVISQLDLFYAALQ